MTTEKKMTGYPSIDKPWLKYYTEKKTDFNVKQTIYHNFKRLALQKPKDLAFIDYKSEIKITYAKLLKQSDEFSSGICAMGLTHKSKVGVLGFNSIIDPIALLGANKIGAAVVFVNPDAGPKEIAESVNNLDILILENIFAELEPIINVNHIPVVIYGDCPQLPSIRCKQYNDFINNKKETEEFAPQKDVPALVIFSSGSTGIPKPIVHSNHTVNAAVFKMLCSDFPINNSNFLIKAIPSHIGLGVITTMLVGLLSGTPYIQLNGLPNPATGLSDETFELISNYDKWLLKNDFNKNMGLILFAAPYFAKHLLSRIDELNDLSMIKGILLGGAKMLKEELDIMNVEFSKKGLQIPICNGYGQNEMGGAVALNTVHYNKNGSAGYPVYNTNIKIIDRDTQEELTYNKVGQIIESSDSKFINYMGMEEKTLASKVVLDDGTEWYDSTDLGYIDEDGFLYITGRTTRVVIKTDHKISLDVVEAKIKGVSGVLDAAVVPFHNSNRDGDTVAFIVLKDKSITLKLEDIKNSKNDLTLFETPVEIKIVDALPRMNNGKVDYQLLEKEAEKL